MDETRAQFIRPWLAVKVRLEEMTTVLYEIDEILELISPLKEGEKAIQNPCVAGAISCHLMIQTMLEAVKTTMKAEG